MTKIAYILLPGLREGAGVKSTSKIDLINLSLMRKLNIGKRTI